MLTSIYCKIRMILCFVLMVAGNMLEHRSFNVYLYAGFGWDGYV